MIANPSQGHFPFWAPGYIFWKVWGDCPQDQVRPGCPEHLKVFDGHLCPVTSKAEGGSCCPQGCAFETCMEVCLNQVPDSPGWLEELRHDSHPAGEEEGGSQDPCPEGRTAHGATAADGEEKGHIHRGPQDPGSWSEPNKDRVFLKTKRVP